MCGIFGHIGFLPRQVAQQCTSALAHRGPDGEGLWHTPEVVLGHRRLSILDLSDLAKQPMQSESGRYWITYNGEIYNFLELRLELEKRGYGFKSGSDTEVVLAAFDAWGEGCQQRFNGMWAFAIWDTLTKRLFLSRDRFGKKPLFYAHLGGKKFAFASEMKAIMPLLGQVCPNRDLIVDTSRIFYYESTSECVIEGISRFPAGYCGWLEQGNLQLRRWWCTLDHLPAVPRKHEEQVEQFREIFMDACRLRMRSDVSIATALSGGLDSSAVISAVVHLARNSKVERTAVAQQRAFVASFPGSSLDETRYAAMVTEHLGIDSAIIDIDPVQGMADLNRYLYLFEDLYITSPIPFMQTYGAIKAKGTSVTLDGHGADELLGGYPSDCLYALQDAGLNLGKVRDILRTYQDAVSVEGTRKSSRFDQLKIFAKWHGKHLVTQMHPAYAGRLKGHDCGHAAWNQLGSLNRQLYLSTHESVLPTLLRNYDRYSMANGVEIRMPFMDHRMVCMAFALPDGAKIRHGFTKAILRDAMAPFMPKAVTERKSKIGFNSPVVEWMKGPLKTFMLDTIESQEFRQCELIQPEHVARKIMRVINDPDARYADGEQAWTLLSPFLWERAVIKRRSAV